MSWCGVGDGWVFNGEAVFNETFGHLVVVDKKRVSDGPFFTVGGADDLEFHASKKPRSPPVGVDAVKYVRPKIRGRQ